MSVESFGSLGFSFLGAEGKNSKKALSVNRLTMSSRIRHHAAIQSACSGLSGSSFSGAPGFASKNSRSVIAYTSDCIGRSPMMLLPENLWSQIDTRDRRFSHLRVFSHEVASVANSLICLLGSES